MTSRTRVLTSFTFSLGTRKILGFSLPIMTLTSVRCAFACARIINLHNLHPVVDHTPASHVTVAEMAMVLAWAEFRVVRPVRSDWAIDLDVDHQKFEEVPLLLWELARLLLSLPSESNRPAQGLIVLQLKPYCKYYHVFNICRGMGGGTLRA